VIHSGLSQRWFSPCLKGLLNSTPKKAAYCPLCRCLGQYETIFICLTRTASWRAISRRFSAACKMCRNFLDTWNSRSRDFP
jgi:hypothetical protein